MRRTSQQLDLPDQLREISALDRSACTERWTSAFGTGPPKYLSVRFMQRVVARERQIRVLGGYSTQVRRTLKSVLRDVEGGGRSARNARQAPTFCAGGTVGPTASR